MFKGVKAAGWNSSRPKSVMWRRNFIDVPEAHRKEVMDFLNALDDHDDVHRVYAALK